MQPINMYCARHRIKADSIVYQSEEAIDSAVKKKYCDPVVLPRSGDKPMIHVKVNGIACDPFDIVAAIEVYSALTAFLRLAVKTYVQPVSVSLYPVAQFTHIIACFGRQFTSYIRKLITRYFY